MVSDYHNREIFSRAPLEYVVCEVRYPIAPALGRETLSDSLLESLSEDLPIITEEQVQTVTVGPGQTSAAAEKRFRFLSRDRTVSAAIARSALTVETTHYREYQTFREQVGRVVSAIAALTPIVGIERIGLRYVNEIRVPIRIESVSSWRGWMADEVLSVLDIAPNIRTNTLESVLRLESDSASITVRLAALTGPGVIGNDPLRRRTRPPAGPFFVVDIDSYWASAEGELRDFESEKLLKLMDDLHGPVGQIFQSTLTDQLRAELREAE